MPRDLEERERRQGAIKAGKRTLLGIPRGYAGALAVLVVSAAVIAGVLLSLSSGGTGSSAPDQAALAPDLTVQTARGSNFTLSDHRGQPVVLFFMAPG